MDNFIKAVDDYVAAARNLTLRKEAEAAFIFWQAQRRLAISAIATGVASWETVRTIIVERHGMPALGVVAAAAAVRSKYFKAPSLSRNDALPGGVDGGNRRAPSTSER